MHIWENRALQSAACSVALKVALLSVQRKQKKSNHSICHFTQFFSIHLTETRERKKERVILKTSLVALSVSDGVTDDSAEITPTGLQSVLPFESGV